jgi:ribonuclease HI
VAMAIVEIYTDGGSRGNPGPSAIGYVIQTQPPVKEGLFIGVQTNNYAEYQALIHALKKTSQLKIDQVKIKMDSELIVKQLLGQYKVKHENMKPLHAEVKKLLEQFKLWTIEHVRREQNTEADELVNIALDQYQKEKSTTSKS